MDEQKIKKTLTLILETAVQMATVAETALELLEAEKEKEKGAAD